MISGSCLRSKMATGGPLLALSLAVAVTAVSDSVPTGNDPFFSQQWSLHNDGKQTIPIEVNKYEHYDQLGKAGVDIGWLDAKKQVAALAKSPVIVAILDTGVAVDHPDLQGRVADIYDPLMQQPDMTDPSGHGTQIAGLIAANTDNGIGIAGIAPATVKILPVRVTKDCKASEPPENCFTNNNTRFHGKVWTDYVADGIRYAVAHGATIINTSLLWARIVDTDNIRGAISDAAKAGVLIVADAGNEARTHSSFPCSNDNVLCVGAITNNGDLAIYSNYGGMIDITAPADNLVSLYPMDLPSKVLGVQGYESFKGTSSSAPEVAGVAATLRSIYPKISLKELKARLLASTSTPLREGSALYGLVNLDRAINAKPQPVYQPHFRTMDDPVLNESTLTINSNISIENLWATGSNVQAKVTVNGQSAGQAQAKTLSTGELLTVPWQYKFRSLSDSAIVHLVLQVSDGAGQSRVFALNVTAARPMAKLQALQTLSLPGANTQTWISNDNGYLSANNLGEVRSYPPEPGLKHYVSGMGVDANGVKLQFFNPNDKSPLQNVQVPGVQYVNEVVRVDMKGDGSHALVIVGLSYSPLKWVNNQCPPPPAGATPYIQFVVLTDDYQPFYGTTSPSVWRVYGATQCDLRSFSAPGSWLRVGDKLRPTFTMNGNLPPKDNFAELDIRHYMAATHLYYLSPLKVSNGVELLEARVVDNAKFRDKYGDVVIRNLIPSSPEEMSQGTVRYLVQTGLDDDSPISQWVVRSNTDATLQAAPNWSPMAIKGQLTRVLSLDPTQHFSAYAGEIDQLGRSGSLSWLDTKGQLVARSDYEYSKPKNPIYNLTGVMDLGNLGRLWFLETGFDMVGFHSKEGKMISQNLPLERDSSVPGKQFSGLLVPVLAGTAAAPLPGVLYRDRNLIRKNEIWLTAWDLKNETLVRPLRYSMRIPDGCLLLDQFRQTQNFSAQAELLNYSLLCPDGSGGLKYQIVAP